ncbi:MAG: lamin tail domain-containing protein, partial [Verrucomicrobia bacterium]|nr:lamin tail domain-containing protein [Verrucomicrobiota bacterium]
MPICRANPVVINEFMAVNDSLLTNAAGDTSDWIELYNNSSNAVNLDGWYLTDDAGDLAKSRLPAITLAPFDYLLVFAAGNPNPIVSGEPHVNFQLSGSGEYLGLVQPDGFTVVSAYAPTYPEQTANISYGLRPDVELSTLLNEGSAFRYRVPVDGSLGTNWTDVNFDDTLWATGIGGIGHENVGAEFAPYIDTSLTNTDDAVYVRYTFTAADVNTLDTLTLFIRYDDGFAIYLNGTRVLTINAPLQPIWSDKAVGSHPDVDAIVFDDFDLSNYVNLLQEGTNVLALHGLNELSNPRNTDMLLEAYLEASSFKPSASAEMRYFHDPTPGTGNRLGEADYVREVDFDHHRGFYDDPFLLTLDVNLDDFSIRYTLDGTAPTTNSLLYAAPLAINGTAVVRARGFRPGFEPSPIVTHTYLFTDDIKLQPTMNGSVVSDPVLGPQIGDSLKGLSVISISTGNDNLFGASAGIYTHSTSRGIDWERPAAVELFNEDGSEEFHINCGLRIYGGYSRIASNKKSFRLLFKSLYGPSKLNFRMFDDATAADQYDTLILRAGFNDRFYANGLKDPFTRRSLLATGQPGSRARFVHLFLDGVYWGIYNPSERCDQAFGATYFDVPDKTQWDAINAGYPTGESQTDTYIAMQAAVNQILSNVTNYMAIQGRNADGTRNPAMPIHLDVDNHIDYILSQVWGQVGDWPGHNWYAGGARTNSTGWKFFCWDTEFGLSNVNGNNVNTSGPMGLQGKLKASPEYKLLFGDHVQRHLFNGGAFTREAVTARYQELVDEVSPGIVANAARWGNTGSVSSWESAQNYLLTTYMQLRTDIVLAQLRAEGLYPTVDAPVFSQHGGEFEDTLLLSITASNQVYYTLNGEDPRTVGSGAIHGATYSAPISLAASTRVKARARTAGGQWSALTEAFFFSNKAQALRVTEVMSHPHKPPTNSPYGANDFEFIEIHNSGTAAINLSFVTFTDGIDFTFPSMLLHAGAYAVVVRNLTAFSTRYATGGMLIAGEYADSLSDGGEKVTLRSGPSGPVVSSFTYGDGRGWPIAADGGGHSLIPLLSTAQTGGELNYMGNWRASSRRGGSPGAADPSP